MIPLALATCSVKARQDRTQPRPLVLLQTRILDNASMSRTPSDMQQSFQCYSAIAIAIAIAITIAISISIAITLTVALIISIPPWTRLTQIIPGTLPDPPDSPTSSKLQ
ncbi:hypothetical protein BJ875DRAFT_486793 [Amylocarpus encephaloides]|uniref:Uncharacterized protein n=1 Tax=Amylocarpus encephaloides TaxID=45428 RepID=A0A9P8C2L8_9HELO|nr:hypothetical protein BJ875DRAFT_486793 [Amylocarpus encephaloides]